MDLEDLTRTLQARGVVLFVRDGRLCVCGSRAGLTLELQAVLRQHARRLVYRLDLYRHLHRGDRVETPAGPGAVLQVFAHRVTVHLDGHAAADALEPEDVRTEKSERREVA